MSKTALLILSEGAEEMEAIISADVLRRAGVKVTIAGLHGPSSVTCSRNVVIVPDVGIQDVLKQNFDAVILPGGLKGAENLAQSDIVKDILQNQEKSGRLIAAICAAPIALKSHSIGIGKRITSYPSKQADLSTGEYIYLQERVVEDEHLITSQGPGTAFEFALAIVKYLYGPEKAASLVGAMLVSKHLAKHFMSPNDRFKSPRRLPDVKSSCVVLSNASASPQLSLTTPFTIIPNHSTILLLVPTTTPRQTSACLPVEQDRPLVPTYRTRYGRKVTSPKKYTVPK